MLIFLAFSLFASAITANKVILYALNAQYLVGIRMTAGALLLALLLYFRTRKLFTWSIVTSFFSWILVIALFTTYFPSNLKAYALTHMPSAKMAFFGTLDPFVTALYSYFWFNERLTKQQWLGILLGFAGMMILIYGSTPLEETWFSIVSYPEFAAFFAIVLSRFGWIQAQQLLKKEHFTPVQLNILLMSIGGVISLTSAYLLGLTSIGTLPDLPVLNMLPLSPSGQLGFFLGWTILMGNVLGYTLYGYALKKYSTTFIPLAGFMIPLLVQLFGWLLLGEALSLLFFIACGVTFLGVLLFYLDERAALITS